MRLGYLEVTWGPRREGEMGDDYQATNNLRLIATIDLTIATVGLLLDIFILSEGRNSDFYGGRQYSDVSFFYLLWGGVFVMLLAQGLMGISLYSAASKFEFRPLKSLKKITVYQIWSIGFLILLVAVGLPAFVATNSMDDFFGFSFTYIIVAVMFRLIAITLVEFNRDQIKREKFYPRVIPPSMSVNSKSAFMGDNAITPVYVNTTVPAEP